MDNEHDDDILPEVQEGSEIETEKFPDTAEDLDESENEQSTDSDLSDEQHSAIDDDDDGDSI